MSNHIIDVVSLVQRQQQENSLLLVDCRFSLADPAAGEAAYHAGHIPGAWYLHLERDLSGPLSDVGGRHPLPDAAAFERLLGGIGVSAETELIAYDGGNGAFAARLWWLARYFGHERVAVLDGGMKAWLAQDGPVDTEVPERQAGRFRAQPRPSMCVDFEMLQQASSARVLIDSREPRRYAGIEEPMDPVAGHIPGAVNMPWQGALVGSDYFIPEGDHATRWDWLGAEQQPVVYCGSGVTACVNLLSLVLAGRQDARLYPGSWSEWCQRHGPVATDTD